MITNRFFCLISIMRLTSNLFVSLRLALDDSPVNASSNIMHSPFFELITFFVNSSGVRHMLLRFSSGYSTFPICCARTLFPVPSSPSIMSIQSLSFLYIFGCIFVVRFRCRALSM